MSWTGNCFNSWKPSALLKTPRNWRSAKMSSKILSSIGSGRFCDKKRRILILKRIFLYFCRIMEIKEYYQKQLSDIKGQLKEKIIVIGDLAKAIDKDETTSKQIDLLIDELGEWF